MTVSGSVGGMEIMVRLFVKSKPTTAVNAHPEMARNYCAPFAGYASTPCSPGCGLFH